MEQLIRNEYGKLGRSFTKFILAGIAVVVLLTAMIIVDLKYSVSDHWYETPACILGIIATIVFGYYYVVPTLNKYKKYFINNTDFLINWKNENGDILLVTEGGLFNHFENQPKEVTKTKFGGIGWSGESMLENVVENGLSLGTIIPGLKLTKVTNRIDSYIEFEPSDKINFTYLEVGEYRIMSVYIKKMMGGRSELNYSLPKNTRFSEADFDAVIATLSKDTRYKIEKLYKDNFDA